MPSIWEALGIGAGGFAGGLAAGTKLRQGQEQHTEEMKLKRQQLDATIKMQEATQKLNESKLMIELQKALSQANKIQPIGSGGGVGPGNVMIPPMARPEPQGGGLAEILQKFGGGAGVPADQPSMIPGPSMLQQEVVPQASQPGAFMPGAPPGTRISGKVGGVNMNIPVNPAPQREPMLSPNSMGQIGIRSLFGAGWDGKSKPTEEMVGIANMLEREQMQGRSPGVDSRLFTDAIKQAKSEGLSGFAASNRAWELVTVLKGERKFTEQEQAILGANTGLAQEKVVETAGLKGEATAAGGIRGQLAPQRSTVTGALMSGTAAVAEARAAGAPIPTGERKALSEFDLISKLGADVVRDSNNFTAPFFGPITGRLGTISEKFTGNMSDEEVNVRRNLQDMKDSLLRARSGAQINEQEYARLARLVPDINEPSNIAKAKMKSFKSSVDTIFAERKRLQSAPAGSLKGAGPRLVPKADGTFDYVPQ